MMILRQTMPTDSVKLSSITTDKFKTGLLAFSVRIPSFRLPDPYALLLAELLGRCTEHYPTKAALSRRLDELYSVSINVRSVKQGKNRIFTFAAEILDNKYATDGTDIASEVCGMLSELMLCPFLDENGLFPEKNVEQEKRRLISSLKSIINNPASYAVIRLSELFCRDDASELSLEEMITAVEGCDSNMLTKLYKDCIASRPIDVFYIGTFSHESIEERVLSHIGDFCATKREAIIPLRALYPDREVCKKQENMPISQGRLAIALTSKVCGSDSDLFAMTLFNEIFGGSPSSKLFMNVREKMSLCYSCGSFYNMGTGSVRVSAGISPENREIAERAILEELDNMKKGRISERELNSAKKSLENAYREIYDNPADLFSFYSNRRSVGISFTVDEARQKIASLTKDDVVRVAKDVRLDAIYFLCGDASRSEEDDYE